jgi:hypothetical protein
MCPFQFLVYYSVFFPGRGSDYPGGYADFIPVVAVGEQHAVYLFTCWSASPKQVWSWHLAVREPSLFLSIMGHREALCELGVRGVRVLLLLGGFSCQLWIQHLNKIFDLWISCYLIIPSHRFFLEDSFHSDLTNLSKGTSLKWLFCILCQDISDVLNTGIPNRQGF